MDTKPVNSSYLYAVGYDPATKILEIEFKDNTVVDYSNVPQSTYDGMMQAQSVGKYFHRNVKDQYAGVRQ